MALRISVAEWSFLKPDQDAAAFYQAVAKLGISGAELVNKSRYDIVRAAGLSLVNRNGPGKWNRLENHPKCLSDLRTAINDAVENDIPAILVFSGDREGQADDVSLNACVEGLSQAAAMAESAGKTLLFEVFNRFDHPDYVADNSAFAYDVVRRVKSKSLLVLYDIYHMLRMEENIEQTLFDNLDLVGHVHIARSPDRKIATDARSIELLRKLERSEYRGFVGAEWLSDQSVAELAEFMDAVRT